MPPSLFISAAAPDSPLVSRAQDQVLRSIPDREPSIDGRVPILRELGPADQLHLAAFGLHDAHLHEPVDGRVLGPAQGLGHAERAFVGAILLEPAAPTRITVELALLFSEDFIQDLVNDTECGSDGHGRAVGFNDLCVASEDGHARADGSLGEVDWGDVALLEVSESLWQLLA